MMIWFKKSNSIKWFIANSNESIEKGKDDADNLDLKWKNLCLLYSEIIIKINFRLLQTKCRKNA